MKTYAKRMIRNFDFPLFFVYLLLTLFGLVMIYSSSMVWAVNKYGYEPDYFFQKQITTLKTDIMCLGAYVEMDRLVSTPITDGAISGH